MDYEKARDQHDEAAIQAVELPAEDMSLRCESLSNCLLFMFALERDWFSASLISDHYDGRC